MSTMRQKLLATAAGLTIAFGGAMQAEAQQQKKAPVADLQTITSLYHTKDSKALSALEARLNQERPAYAPRIIYLDPDIMATWLQLKGDMSAYPAMTAEYLTAKKSGSLDAQDFGGLVASSLTGRPGAVVPQLRHPELAGQGLDTSTCIVAPYNPNLSADAYMRTAFDLANAATGKEANVLKGMKLEISFTRQDMEEIIDAREAWGCFDTQFVTQVSRTQNFDRIMSMHRTEVFKDVGGLMQAVKDGGDPSLITKFADFRAAAAALTTRTRGALFQPAEVPFYGSAIYETSPALADLKARIDQMGVEKFRALSGEDMVKLATDITAKSALTAEQATHIMGFAMLGNGYFRSLELAKADPAAVAAAKAEVTAALKRQSAAVEKSVRPLTDDELVKSLVPLVTQDFTYAYLQRQIFGDAAVQKDPDDPVARFRVRQELMDKTRALMDQHPEGEGVIRQVLQGIFLSNPMMEKAPPPQAAPSKPQRLLEA